MLYSVLIIVQVLVSIALIALVLMQHGKGADAGAAFGSGSSASVFGSAGSGNFLSRSTSVLAAVFFANSLALAYLASYQTAPAKSVLESAPAEFVDQPVERMAPMDVPE